MVTMSDIPEENIVSKSQRKREFLELQLLAQKLVGLSGNQLQTIAQTIALSEELTIAVNHGRSLERAPLRRQIRYLAKLLNEADHLAIKAAVMQCLQGSATATAQLHRIERWRDRLLNEGDAALSALVAQCPDFDRQRLRQLVRAARQEKERASGNKAFRALFQCLREQDL